MDERTIAPELADRTLASGLRTLAPSDESMPEFAPGTLFGPYRIERVLGSGGMGCVYAAEHIEQQRRVALKVLTRGIASEDALQQFLMEGRSAAAMSHPHTVYVYGSETIDGVPVIAMELIPAGTLQDRVSTDGPLSVDEAVDAILQVIDGLNAAFNVGVLHRDVKPANCFIDNDNGIKVGDFGLALSLAGDATVETRCIVGTPAFASPEQMQGQRLDVRTDIYSVGATLFYLLTGTAPFQESDLGRLIALVKGEPAPAIRSRRRDIPKALEQAIARCLEKDADARPATYDALAALLAPFRSGVAQPAALRTRVIAHLIDQLLLIFVVFGIRRIQGDAAWWLSYASTLTGLVYFGVTEGVYGASLGKAICRLAVVRRGRHTTSLVAAFVRSTVFAVALMIPDYVLAVLTNVGAISVKTAPNVPPVLSAIVVSLLFLPARKRNGYAAVHEWISGTRTIRRQPDTRDGLANAQESRLAQRQAAVPLGPYLVEQVPASGRGPAWLDAYDQVLHRSIWLRVDDEDASGARRELRRRTRLQWLNGGIWQGHRCEAFEALAGQSLMATVKSNGPQQWRIVQAWISELADEIVAALADGTVPLLSLDHVWIDVRGRARLLDWPAPGTTTVALPTFTTGDVVRDAQQFLAAVAMAGLGGADVHARRVTPGDAPLRAMEMLHAFAEPRFIRLDEIVNSVRAASHWPTTIPGGARVMQVLFAAAGLTAIQLAISAWSFPASLMPMAGALLLVAVSAAATRGGLGIRLIGGALVTRDGHECSRARAAARAVLAWIPLIALTYPMLAVWSLLIDVLMRRATPLQAWVSSGPLLVAMAFIAWIVYSSLQPERDWYDCLAGTWLIPR